MRSTGKEKDKEKEKVKKSPLPRTSKKAETIKKIREKKPIITFPQVRGLG